MTADARVDLDVDRRAPRRGCCRGTEHHAGW